ncbi:MAG: hypothetical protein LBO67_05285 [Spirochaetaceae bacterium]|jgi:hypothetical protein|nr:hypothetical protein [Spirochaetaceae bacterium]
MSEIDAEDVERNIDLVCEAEVRFIFAKPIERFLRTLHGHCDILEKSYVESNTVTRSDEAKVYQQALEKMKEGK